VNSIFLNGDAQGAQKVYILRIKRLIPFQIFARRSLEFRTWLLFNLVQSNRRFQHQKHIEALFADILHYLGDLLGLGNRLMNGFPQLLDKSTKSLVQRCTPIRHPRAVLHTLLLMLQRSNLNQPADKLLRWSQRK
jgi:hypothetical protein